MINCMLYERYLKSLCWLLPEASGENILPCLSQHLQAAAQSLAHGPFHIHSQQGSVKFLWLSHLSDSDSPATLFHL